jgi:hypothetical protein
LIAVELYRRENGHGPTWGQLSRALGLVGRRERGERIFSLLEVGLRWRRGEPNSLNVTDWGLRRALLVARKQHEART